MSTNTLTSLAILKVHVDPLRSLVLIGCGREGRSRTLFCCNLMYRKVLVSSHQHLMAEAPLDRLFAEHNRKGRDGE